MARLGERRGGAVHFFVFSSASIPPLNPAPTQWRPLPAPQAGPPSTTSGSPAPTGEDRGRGPVRKNTEGKRPMAVVRRGRALPFCLAAHSPSTILPSFFLISHSILDDVGGAFGALRKRGGPTGVCFFAKQKKDTAHRARPSLHFAPRWFAGRRRSRARPIDVRGLVPLVTPPCCPRTAVVLIIEDILASRLGNTRLPEPPHVSQRASHIFFSSFPPPPPPSTHTLFHRSGMGAVGGGIWHLLKGMKNSPGGARFRGGFEVRRRDGARRGVDAPNFPSQPLPFSPPPPPLPLSTPPHSPSAGRPRASAAPSRSGGACSPPLTARSSRFGER